MGRASFFAAALVLVLGLTALGLASVFFRGKDCSSHYRAGRSAYWRPMLDCYATCLPICFAVNASTILSIAFMFSCGNMKPAAATIPGVVISVRERGDGGNSIFRPLRQLVHHASFSLLAVCSFRTQFLGGRSCNPGVVARRLRHRLRCWRHRFFMCATSSRNPRQTGLPPLCQNFPPPQHIHWQENRPH